MRRKTLRTALAFLFIALAGVVLASMRRGDTSNAQAEMERYLERVVSVLPGTPGADDNASGVAATLLLAKLLADEPQERLVLSELDHQYCKELMLKTVIPHQ